MDGSTESDGGYAHLVAACFDRVDEGCAGDTLECFDICCLLVVLRPASPLLGPVVA
jgi:hypothetical protein